MQKLRSYTQYLTHNDMPNLDYLFFHTPCTREPLIDYREQKLLRSVNSANHRIAIFLKLPKFAHLLRS